MRHFWIIFGLVGLFLVACGGAEEAVQAPEPAVVEAEPTAEQAPVEETVPEPTEAPAVMVEDEPAVVEEAPVEQTFEPWDGPIIAAAEATAENPAPLGTTVAFEDGMHITFVNVVRPAVDLLAGVVEDEAWIEILRNEADAGLDTIAVEVVVTCTEAAESCPVYEINQLVGLNFPLITLDGRDRELVPILNYLDWEVGETRHGLLFASGFDQAAELTSVQVGIRSYVDFEQATAYFSLGFGEPAAESPSSAGQAVDTIGTIEATLDGVEETFYVLATPDESSGVWQETEDGLHFTILGGYDSQEVPTDVFDIQTESASLSDYDGSMFVVSFFYDPETDSFTHTMPEQSDANVVWVPDMALAGSGASDALYVMDEGTLEVTSITPNADGTADYEGTFSGRLTTLNFDNPTFAMVENGRFSIAGIPYLPGE